MRPTPEGLVISPAIPSKWDGMKMEKNFRGSHLSIKVENPNHVSSGVKSVTLNGETLEGNLIPASKMKDQNEVVVVLG